MLTADKNSSNNPVSDLKQAGKTSNNSDNSEQNSNDTKIIPNPDIIVLGLPGSGKTKLINRWISKGYTPTYIPTNETDLVFLNANFYTTQNRAVTNSEDDQNNTHQTNNNNNPTLRIYEIAGTASLKTHEIIRKKINENKAIILFCIDVTDPLGIEKTKKLYARYQSHFSKDSVVYFVFTKVDSENVKLTDEQCRQFANEYNISLKRISAKTGEQTEELLRRVVKKGTNDTKQDESEVVSLIAPQSSTTESRALFVGNGESGKSSLITSLKKKQEEKNNKTAAATNSKIIYEEHSTHFQTSLSSESQLYTSIKKDNIVVFTIDVTNPKALEDIRKIYKQHKKLLRDPLKFVYFVFTKNDTKENDEKQIVIKKMDIRKIFPNDNEECVKVPTKIEIKKVEIKETDLKKRIFSAKVCQDFAKEFNIPDHRVFSTNTIDGIGIERLRKQIANDCQKLNNLSKNPLHSLYKLKSKLTYEAVKKAFAPTINKTEYSINNNDCTRIVDLKIWQKLDFLYEVFKFIIENPKGGSHHRSDFWSDRQNQQYSNLDLHNIKIIKKVYYDLVKTAVKSSIDIVEKEKLIDKIVEHQSLIKFHRTTYESFAAKFEFFGPKKNKLNSSSSVAPNTTNIEQTNSETSQEADLDSDVSEKSKVVQSNSIASDKAAPDKTDIVQQGSAAASSNKSQFFVSNRSSVPPKQPREIKKTATHRNILKLFSEKEEKIDLKKIDLKNSDKTKLPEIINPSMQRLKSM